MKILIINGSLRKNGNTSLAFDEMEKVFVDERIETVALKVGASVVCTRRGGCSSTFDELNKYFTISGMPVASSQY